MRPWTSRQRQTSRTFKTTYRRSIQRQAALGRSVTSRPPGSMLAKRQNHETKTSVFLFDCRVSHMHWGDGIRSVAIRELENVAGRGDTGRRLRILKDVGGRRHTE